MSSATKFLITLSVLTSLGGAVNSGWSYFGVAVPFMVYLLVAAYRLKRSVFVGTVFFVVLCIITSLTRDYNPFIYPIILNGEVTVLQDGYHTGWHDGSGGFHMEEQVKRFVNYTDETGANKLNELISSTDKKTIKILDKNAFSKGSEIIVTKLKKGDKFEVTGIKHNYADLGSDIAIVTPIGQFGYYNDKPFGPYKSDTEMKAFLETNKPVQSMFLSVLSSFPLLLVMNPLIFFAVFGIAYLILTLLLSIAKKMNGRHSNVAEVVNPQAGDANSSTGSESAKDAETEAPESKVEEEKK